MASSQMRQTTGRGDAPCGVSGSSVSRPPAAGFGGECGGEMVGRPRGDGGSRGAATRGDPNAEAAAAAAAAACERRSDVVLTVSGLRHDRQIATSRRS
jgi:hypothetical protein